MFENKFCAKKLKVRKVKPWENKVGSSATSFHDVTHEGELIKERNPGVIRGRGKSEVQEVN